MTESFLPATALWTAIAAGLAGGCVQSARQPAGPHFSVVTYNVNCAMPMPQLAVEAIRQSGADVVCLQETTPAWEAYLSARIGSDYPHRLFRHSGGAGGQAVLSKIPVDEVAHLPPAGQGSWFPAWVLKAHTPVGAVQILGVHLRPQIGGNGSVGIGQILVTEQVRKVEVERLHPHLKKDLPVIILGDFNENDSDAAVGWLKSQGFTDALGQFDLFSSTWRWGHGLLTLRARLDHVMYSRHLRCLSARVIDKGASDHLPVLAVFEGK